MKIIICLNQDIHCATALNLLLPHLTNHQVRIILSNRVGKSEQILSELKPLKDCEQDKLVSLFAHLDNGTVANQLFRRIFRNSDFFQTHVHMGTLTFEKNQNHKNFLEKLDLRQCHNRGLEVGNKFKTFNQIAEIFGSEIFSYQDINSPIALKDFKEFAPDLIISIRFGQIFKNEIIAIPSKGVINLHSGILPDFRGIMPSFWAILNGSKSIGTTLHYISDSKIDAGDIIEFTHLEVDKNRSLIFNINKLYEDGCEAIARVIAKLSDDLEIKTTRQNDLGQGQYFSYPKDEEIKKFLAIMELVTEKDAMEIVVKWID